MQIINDESSEDGFAANENEKYFLFFFSKFVSLDIWIHTDKQSLCNHTHMGLFVYISSERVSLRYSRIQFIVFQLQNY